MTHFDSLRVIRAADALDAFLHSNTGTTSDWPVEIHTDPDVTQKLVDLLNELRDSLQPYRESMNQEKK